MTPFLLTARAVATTKMKGFPNDFTHRLRETMLGLNLPHLFSICIAYFVASCLFFASAFYFVQSEA